MSPKPKPQSGPEPHDVLEFRFERRRHDGDAQYRLVIERTLRGKTARKELPWQQHRAFLAELAVLDRQRVMWLSGDEAPPTWAIG